MAALVRWYTSDKLLYIKFDGSINTPNLENISQQVIDILDRTENTISIIMDATDLECGYQSVNQLRDTQQYVNHDRMGTAFIVSANKLNHLIFLMAFNTSRAPIKKHITLSEAEAHLAQRGFITE